MAKISKREMKKIEKEDINFTIGRIRGIARNYGDERLTFLINKISKDLSVLKITPF